MKVTKIKLEHTLITSVVVTSKYELTQEPWDVKKLSMRRIKLTRRR